MKEGAISSHSTATSDQPWDAGAVVGAIPDTATPADLKKEFAWVDSGGDPNSKASYKFPHHDSNGDANLAAASAGIGVLNGGRGGASIPDSDRSGVYAHLAKHIKDAGKEAPALEAGAPAPGDVQALLDELSGHLDSALQVYDDLVAAIGGKGGGDMQPPAGDGTKPPPAGKPADMLPGQSAEAMAQRRKRRAQGYSGAFDPKNRESLQALAEAMVEDASFAAQVVKVASGLRGSELPGDFVAIQEKAIRHDDTAYIKLIQPGWGSSGYYAPEMLERDGPGVFKAGTKMYWNHQTDLEEQARPEGDLYDLAGELMEDARWMAEGPEGAGLYANAKVFAPFKDMVEELAPHIGVSIRAFGKASEGQAEGKDGTIIDALTYGQSVDYVTEPGAGGKVLQLFESAHKHKEEQMSDQDKQELKELREATAAREAKDAVSKAIEKSELPEASQKRIVESLTASPKLTDEGKLDEKALGEAADAAVKAEAEYLSELGAGGVRGLGGSTTTQDPEKAKEELAKNLQGLGMTESAAKAAAAAR